MPSRPSAASPPKFCSNCGTQLNTGASFCHMCGAAVEGRSAGVAQSSAPATAPTPSGTLRWGVPALALVVLVILTAMQFSSRVDQTDAAGAMPLGSAAMRAPDISAMSPRERADRLFNRVMLLSSQGKMDSVAFFAPMAIGAIEALAPLDAHLRYDLGLVALVMGDSLRARTEAEAILAGHPTHLLGLLLAARAANARGDATAEADLRRRLSAAEQSERARALPEYADHDADIRAAMGPARTP